jgi:membrane complex biogenesis BtpA family protein
MAGSLYAACYHSARNATCDRIDARARSIREARTHLGRVGPMSLAAFVGADRAVIGMVHLGALPGSPRWAGSMDAIARAAIADAQALAEGGADALLVENWGDAPFAAGRVDAGTVAAMSVVTAEIARATALPFGVNVLRSDALSALAVAAATGARFVRVNVHVGAVATDQGILESAAHDSLRYRRLLGLDIKILADVQAKHGMPLAPVPLEHEARDCVSRGLADALIVTGAATGEPAAMRDLERVRRATPHVPLLVGSGVTAETAAELLSVADGLIVGTALKRDGIVTNPVDPLRVKRLVEAARG